MASSAYREYIGVDISDVAIEKATMRSADNGRAGKNTYFQCDIDTYVPGQKFDVIVFRDSIYYVPAARIKGLLERYAKCLKQGGVIIVRMWSAECKYKSIVDTIEGAFEVVEKYLSDEPKTAILVFRDRHDLRAGS